MMKLEDSSSTRGVAGYALMKLLGAIFLASSIYKLREPYQFLSIVYQYQIVGPTAGLLVAMLIPWLEFVVGICLIAEIFPRGTLVLAIMLCSAFIFVNAFAIHQNLGISCGCFGAMEQGKVNYTTLLRAGAMLLVSVYLLTVSAMSRRMQCAVPA